MRIFNICISTIFGLLLLHSSVTAQHTGPETIKTAITQQNIEFNIYFLAADEFLGRDTGTNELDIASRYIATTFQVHGIRPAPGHDSYFQNVPFRQIRTPDAAKLAIADSTYKLSRDIIAMSSFRGDLSGEIVHLEYASEDEIANADISGKIVVAKTGLPGRTGPRESIQASTQKAQWVRDAGGIALVERLTQQQMPWQTLVGFLGRDRLFRTDNGEQAGEELPHIWLQSSNDARDQFLTRQVAAEASLSIEGEPARDFYSRNVVGIIEGTDPELKDEYILLSAHYDHVGVASDHPDPISSDYIYNGARDNAVGTTGVIEAAKYFSQNPPRRSVLLAAWTAEERGLLGSGYFAENPMVPLNQIIYNLNIDGAGYNDTTKVTVIGLGRTEADDDMASAAAAFGLEAIPDPVPEQNLFNRSDNVHFARAGIPAPTYSMGLTAFDDEINYYYHQTTDEPHTLNYEYVTAYIRSFVLAAQNIADRDEAPFWLPGDEYKEAGKELYNR
jgi:hypothetical protein